VGPPVFKTGVRVTSSQAGSIPVRLRDETALTAGVRSGQGNPASRWGSAAGLLRVDLGSAMGRG
jgi:hypothetical protein